MGGADIVQLRMKGASREELIRRSRAVAKEVQGLGAIFIVNDDPVAAVESGADGVHIGQDDLGVEAARRIVGAGLIVGKSTHSPEQALAASREAVDYLGFGPMFSTPTKPDYKAIGPDQIARITGAFDVPFFAIGGIDLGTLPGVLATGAERVAVVRAVQDAADVRAAARTIKNILTNQEANA